ncbi:MAG: dihydroneopterin aldolase [Bacteroidales bacterium]|nr:dihydroneopterin aldolase [Bacteroidales bacterium]
MTMDYLQLNEMKFFAYHGVNEQERIVGNTYLVNLKLSLDMSKACQSDQLEDTLNYAKVYKQVAAVMHIPCNLIEHLAEKICRQLRHTFPEIQGIEVKVKKCHPPIVGIMESAEVILER